MQLSWYVNDTQTLIRDSLSLLLTQAQLKRWINEARKQTAYATRSINLLATGVAPFGNAAQAGIMVPGGGTPGSAPTTQFNTISGQEKYPYSMALAQIQSANAGIDHVFDVTSVAVSWGSMKPALAWMPWQDIQAYARSYNFLVTSYPLVWATDGDGANANMWMWPVPQQQLDMEWNCICSPAPLYSDNDYDALPHPWQNAVKYYAAYLTYLSTNRQQMAEMYLQMWAADTGRARGVTERARVTEFYNY